MSRLLGAQLAAAVWGLNMVQMSEEEADRIAKSKAEGALAGPTPPTDPIRETRQMRRARERRERKKI